MAPLTRRRATGATPSPTTREAAGEPYLVVRDLKKH